MPIDMMARFVQNNMYNMKVETSTLRKNLSRYLDMVRSGNTLIITKHGKPEGKLVPMKKKKLSNEDIEAFCGMQNDRKEEDGVVQVNRMRSQRRF